MVWWKKDSDQENNDQANDKKPVKKEEGKVEDHDPVDIDPFTGSQRRVEVEDEYIVGKVNAKFKREQRELYEMAMLMEGFLQKKSSHFLLGNQKRFFKVIANGGYLAYYKSKPQFGETVTPNGVYTIKSMRNIIRVENPNFFQFEYNTRTYDFKSETKQQTDLWVECLKFLNDLQMRTETISSSKAMSKMYFQSLPTFTSVVDDQRVGKPSELEASKDDLIRQSIAAKKDKDKDKKPKANEKPEKPADMVKFNNIDAFAYAALCQENPKLRTNIIHQKNPTMSASNQHVIYSLRALQCKKIWDYLQNIDKDIVRSRIMFGFLRKRSKGLQSIQHNRWWILISSRPLGMEDFLRDTEVLNEAKLPPLFEFDTIYQYFMDTSDDSSGHSHHLRTSDIISIKILKKMGNHEKGHSFILDTGTSKLQLNALYKFEMERWVEAIVISMQTAREAKLSLTGATKNISKMVTQYDMDKDKLIKNIQKDLQKKLPPDVEDWDRDVEVILQACEVVREELIETFDSCLTLKPQRKDIICSWMEVHHVHLVSLLGNFWEKFGVDLNPYETLSVIDFAYTYYNKQRKFGVREDSLYNGFIILCNAYSRKIHSQITPLILGVLENESNDNAVEADHNGILHTVAPEGLIKLFFEAFQVVKIKNIKELMLKLLKVYEEITNQFQTALRQFLEKQMPKLSIEFRIAQCNNFFLFWQLLQSLVGPLLEEQIATDEEISEHYNERRVINQFNEMQDMLIKSIADMIFLKPLPDYNNNRPISIYFKDRTFIDLDMQGIINQAFLTFENLNDMMEEKTKRTAWMTFLENTVFCYIQCLLGSCSKIDKKKASAAIEKVKEDKDVIESRFLQYMSPRVLKSGIEVMEDIITFFECSPSFISLPCEKLRRMQGKQFNYKIVSNLMSLRVDLSRQEINDALKLCKDILDNFREDLQVDKNGRTAKGLFAYAQQNTGGQSTTDTTRVTEQTSKPVEESVEEEQGFDMDNFLNEGGLEEDKKKIKKMEEAADRQTEVVSEDEDENKDVEADEQMSGYLIMTKNKLDKQKGINLDNIVGDVGGIAKNAFKLVGNAIPINRGTFFAIKKGILYEYRNENSRDCQSKLQIQKLGPIDKNYQNEKQFQMMYKTWFITMDCPDIWLVQKWINSLKLIKENPEEYTDQISDLFSGNKKDDKYMNLAVYQKITVKSAFKDYDVLCEEYEHKNMVKIYLKSMRYLAVQKKIGAVLKQIVQKSEPAKQAIKQMATQLPPEKKGLMSSLFGSTFDTVNKNAAQTTKFQEKQGYKGETKDEKYTRYQYMMTLDEFNELELKVNPNQIDFYQACFGSDGQKGQLCCVIDEKARQIIESREKMGLMVELEDEQQHELNTRTKAAGKLMTAGRPSHFVEGGLDHGDTSIMEDPNDEYSETESEPDSSQFDMLDESNSDDD